VFYDPQVGESQEPSVSGRMPKRRIVGRPSKLTPQVRDRLLHALRAGNYRNVACRYAGISEPTFHRWETDERPEFREFRGLVEQAEAEAEKAVVGNLVELSKRDYRAAIAWLERRAPERWRLDTPVSGAVEEYRPVAIAQDAESEQGTLFSIPAAMIEPFFLAARQFNETGVMPGWVSRGEEELRLSLAGLYETADDD
jgi:hypothetical protein